MSPETVTTPPRVRLDVWCVNGHLIATYYDRIEEKYPFHCGTCEEEFGDGDCREGKWPWKLTSAIEPASAT